MKTITSVSIFFVYLFIALGLLAVLHFWDEKNNSMAIVVVIVLCIGLFNIWKKKLFLALIAIEFAAIFFAFICFLPYVFNSTSMAGLSFSHIGFWYWIQVLPLFISSAIIIGLKINNGSNNYALYVLGFVLLSSVPALLASEHYLKQESSRALESAAAPSEEVASPETYTNSIGMEFTLIPAGSFMMGCNSTFESCSTSETPQHRVQINTPFYLGITEVTQEQWVTVMEHNPSHFKGRANPVEQVSWNDAQAFVRVLNLMEDCTDCYRLPSEAEWEYAARAGATTAYWFGDSADDLGQYAWFADNSNDKTHPVGQTPANPWGLYDMHGNVWEWVQDCYHESYSGAPTDGGARTTGCYKLNDGTTLRVLRGGSWNDDAVNCRAASRRDVTSPAFSYKNYGFRVVRMVSL